MGQSRIVLIGFRGTGKSTLSKLLHRQLGMEHYSTDDEIVRQQSCTIKEIVEQKGWSGFREIEHNVIQSLREYDGIIDCGGGVVECSANKEYLRKNSLVVWVDASEADIIQRLSAHEQNESNQRPLLSEASLINDIVTNYARRKPIYQDWSSFVVNTSDCSANECIESIIQHFRTIF